MRKDLQLGHETFTEYYALCFVLLQKEGKLHIEGIKIVFRLIKILTCYIPIQSYTDSLLDKGLPKSFQEFFSQPSLNDAIFFWARIEWRHLPNGRSTCG